MKLRKNKKGFTLIEIIVVLVIMGILLAIAIPAILGYVSQAQDAKYLAQARGGYLAAQTISAKKAANKEVLTGKNELNSKALNEELGFTAGTDYDKDGYIRKAKCTINVDDYAVTSCEIQVKGLDSTKIVKFTEKEAVVTTGSITDTSSDKPANP